MPNTRGERVGFCQSEHKNRENWEISLMCTVDNGFAYVYSIVLDLYSIVLDLEAGVIFTNELKRA